MKNLLLIMGISILTTACASRASSIAPVAVSAQDYAGIECADTRALLSDAREQENALTRRQNNAALGDTVGVVLLLLPIGSIFGADVQGELAEAKGNVNALERAVVINCRATN